MPPVTTTTSATATTTHYAPGENPITIHGFHYDILLQMDEVNSRGRLAKRTWILRGSGPNINDVFQWSTRPNRHGETFKRPRADAHLEHIGLYPEMRWLHN